jgi:2-polyprenyl-6-methoxyphenol hydroxylase-like FAD-dependent oxidoreductase
MREERTEVLVVGAGPVGLLSSLLLAEAGLEVTVIDREERTAARSYACALHPRALKLLARLGLASPLLEQGQRVRTVAFYDGDSRRAEIQLGDPEGEFPFLLILPQNALESVLEQRLLQAGVKVNWNHRFDAVQDEPEDVAATVEELSGTSTGYIVPHWETVVKRRAVVRAQFVVGADGQRSMVRQRMGIESERVAGPDFFAAYEFEAETKGPDEVRVVLDDSTTNVLWPLPGNKCRWTFQMVHSRGWGEFPDKERRAVHLERPAVDERIRQYVQKVAGNRAPWFLAGVKQVTWCTEVVFEHRLARQFGRNRCWLAGDAAHQTGPVGVQSMNVGFFEAEALAGCLQKIVRENAPLELLEGYDRQWQGQWKRLLGLTGGLKAGSQTGAWARDHAARILSCLPGSGGDLEGLARQLHLEFL